MLLKRFCLLCVICLCFVERTHPAASTNTSCAPSAVVSVRNYTSAPTYYGNSYEMYYFTYTVVLEDCTRCRGTRQFVGAKVSSLNATWNVAFRPVNTTAGEEIEWHQALRERMLARTDMPAWFAARVLDFYETFAGPQGKLNCLTINEASGRETFGDESSRVVDLNTLRVIPWHEVCPLLVQRYTHLPSIFFYFAFFGYNSLGYIFFDIAQIFPNEALDRAQRAYVLAFAYSMPLTVCLLLFALYVVKRSLDTSDSHVYHYHKWYVLADILIAILVFLKETQLLPFFMLPFCYAAPTSFKSYLDVLETFVGQSVAERQLFTVFPIVSVVCFTSVLQAMLALDRFAALFCPIPYRRIANTNIVRKLILVAMAIAVVSAAADLATDYEFRCIVNPQQTGCGYLGLAGGIPSSGKLVRASVLLLSLLTQVCCCSCIFVKMLLRMRTQQQQNHIPASPKRLVPFYLLFGTCGLGIVSLFCEALQFVFDYNYKLSSAVGMFLSGADLFLLSSILARFRISVISACSSEGLILHLLVSSHCRSAAKYGFLVGINQLKTLLSKAFVLRALIGSFERVARSNVRGRSEGVAPGASGASSHRTESVGLALPAAVKADIAEIG